MKWLLVSFALLNLVFWMAEMLSGYLGTENVQYTFSERATGKYAYAFWLMFTGSLILPFSLFVKKIGNNIYLVLLVSILANIGWLMEMLVIHVMSSDNSLSFPSKKELILVLQGVLIGLILTVIGNLIDKSRRLKAGDMTKSIVQRGRF